MNRTRETIPADKYHKEPSTEAITSDVTNMDFDDMEFRHH